MNSQIITTGLKALSKIDNDFAKAFKEFGAPPPRLRPKGFETFLSIIVSQQISTEAARAIMSRVTGLLPEITANAFLKIDEPSLREAGLSFRKIEYAKGLAEAIQSGHFDIMGLDAMSDKDVIDVITSIRGFGRWSAEIYLMFSMKRQDIFPADDLAIQVALGRLKGLDKKPTPKQARDLVEHWSPWRSVGSLFLWHYYRGAPT